MRELSLSEIKNTELNILLALQKICDENGLRLYLCEGTLLGAVRHKGFIPWDDDIDVCLPRNDYIKLISLFKRGALPEEYQLLCFELNSLRRPFIKIIDKRTVIINEKKYITDANAPSVFIDVFPVDGMPEDYGKTKKIYKKVKLARKCLLACCAKLGTGRNIAVAIGRIIVYPFLMILGGSSFWNRIIIKEATSNPYETAKYVGIITYGAYGINERMEKGAFEKDTIVEFEGHQFRAMACWHEYLTNLYGDYMELPPEEERKNVHGFRAYYKDG